MTKIVEIIPDKLPKWATDAMEEGQLFNVMLEVVHELVDGLRPFSHKDLRAGLTDIPDSEILMYKGDATIALGDFRTAYDLVDAYETLDDKTGE